MYRLYQRQGHCVDSTQLIDSHLRDKLQLVRDKRFSTVDFSPGEVQATDSLSPFSLRGVKLFQGVVVNDSIENLSSYENNDAVHQVV
ncbi:hypothetical protein TNIN_7831 [Trichonephila inaurata madagascariensis]|uniref:Uncharacterized protein n=1 Tax=Trichonephila inaurata madagascariensis TaxID=2747483 RepID=A0A8X6XL84_9ARAC|nr:hypothetical protein TNIN_7831 [Trichonephila inaurata madagascariensis]